MEIFTLRKFELDRVNYNFQKNQEVNVVWFCNAV